MKKIRASRGVLKNKIKVHPSELLTNKKVRKNNWLINILLTPIHNQFDHESTYSRSLLEK